MKNEKQCKFYISEEMQIRMNRVLGRYQMIHGQPLSMSELMRDALAECIDKVEQELDNNEK